MRSFEDRLLGDEDSVSRDEAKLQRDQDKLGMDDFAAKLGQGPDLRLAQNDAGVPADAMPGEAAGIRRSLAPSMADFGGPQLSAPPPGAAMPSMEPPPGGGGISQRLTANVNGMGSNRSPFTATVPGSVPLDQALAGAMAPKAAPPPGYITNPGAYMDPNMGQPQPAPARSLAPMIVGGGMGANDKGILGTYDDQASHMQQSALQHAEAQRGHAGALEQQAAFMEQRAREQEQLQAASTQKKQNWLDASDKMNNAYASGEIDPNRAWHKADTGTKVAMGIAAFLGAIVPGVKPLSKLVFGSAEDDAAAQKEAYERKGAAVKNRDTLFGHFMKISDDVPLAHAQTTSALIDAQKIQIMAQAERLGVPEALTNAKIAVDVLSREQKTLKKQIGDKANAAAAGQMAAAQARADKLAEQAWQHKKDLVNMDQEQQKIDVSRVGAAGKETDAQKEAAKATLELQAQTDALNAPKTENLIAGSSLGNAWSHLPAFVPGAQSAKEHSLDRKDYNNQVRLAIGSAYKGGTDAMEPKNLALIKEYEEAYAVEPGDNAAVAEHKRAAVKKFLAANLAAKGGKIQWTGK